MKNINVPIRIFLNCMLISVLKGHIRTILHQLRLRVVQIELESTNLPEEMELRTLLQKDYYYKKILPFIICDSVKEQYFYQNRKVLQNGVMTDVSDVDLCE